MGFLSRFTSPHRTAEKRFERARAAEVRQDFDLAKQLFTEAAAAFDAHFQQARDKDKTVRPSHLAMAGICFVRLGRNQDAREAFDQLLAAKDVPDAYFHAGYAAAKQGDRKAALAYWKQYPEWADQHILYAAIQKELPAASEDIDLESACTALAEAAWKQDKDNAKKSHLRVDRQRVIKRRGY